MYLMEGPAQFAAARYQPRLGMRRRVDGRRAAAPQLGGSATKMATSTGTGVATTILAASPATGPLAPFVGAIAGILALFSKLLSWHGDPRDPVDASLVESGLASCYDIWLAVSGEAMAGAGEPKSYKQTGSQQSYVNLSTWNIRTSAYPNVPNGPLGDPTIDIDMAIAGVQEIMGQIQNQLADPGSTHYTTSMQNPFFTNGGGGVIPLLQKVKAAREAAAVAQASSPTSSLISSPTAASLLPIAAGALLIYALSAGE
jgi:hypothetical protein